MGNGIWKPYIDESPFNIKIPKDAKVHPNSDSMMLNMVKHYNQITGGFGGSPMLMMASREWSAAHFFVDSSNMDFIDIRSHYWWGHGAICPMPVDVMSTITNADAAVSIMDLKLGKQWEFWELHGEYPNITCGNGSSGSLNGDGALRNGARESGLFIHSGCVDQASLESDAIEHALIFVYDARDGFENFIYPATSGADFDSSSSEDYIELGTRLRLKSNFNMDKVKDPYARKILQCIRDYGMYLVDENDSWSIGIQWNNLEDIDKYFGGEFEEDLLSVTPEFLEVVNFEI